MAVAIFFVITFLVCIFFRTDPSPWLLVSDALKEKNKAKAYDPKKSVWVPNKVKNLTVKIRIQCKNKVSDIPAEDGKNANLFLQCTSVHSS